MHTQKISSGSYLMQKQACTQSTNICSSLHTCVNGSVSHDHRKRPPSTHARVESVSEGARAGRREMLLYRWKVGHQAHVWMCLFAVLFIYQLCLLLHLCVSVCRHVQESGVHLKVQECAPGCALHHACPTQRISVVCNCSFKWKGCKDI